MVGRWIEVRRGHWNRQGLAVSGSCTRSLCRARVFLFTTGYEHIPELTPCGVSFIAIIVELMTQVVESCIIP